MTLYLVQEVNFNQHLGEQVKNLCYETEIAKALHLLGSLHEHGEFPQVLATNGVKYPYFKIDTVDKYKGHS